MIKKIIKISGTGKFLNYSRNLIAEVYRTNEFKKINLIYGENGSGKTTLSVILKSMKGNNELLMRIRSFDKTFPQSVEILTDCNPDPIFKYENNAWNQHYPNLEIFDIHFVNENIYTGLEIENTHRKKLFEIVLGSQGVRLKKDIQDIKEKIQETNSLIRETKEEIELAIDNVYSAEEFCAIKDDPDIDNKIATKQKQIQIAKSFQLIQSKQSLTQIPLIRLPYSRSVAVASLNKSINNISEKYLKMFNNHKEYLKMNGQEEEWIKQGYGAIRDDICPFCKQNIKDVEIIEAYNQYFNQEYNLLLQTISELNSSVANYNLEAQLLLIESVISTNQGLIEFWETHLPEPPEIASISGRIKEIMDAFETVKLLIKSKALNPIKAQDTKDIEAFHSMIDTLNEQLTNFNKEIRSYNVRINELKSSEKPQIKQLKLDMKKLEAAEKRYTAPLMELCTSFKKYEEELKMLNSNKSEKQKILDEFSKTIFSNYSSKINNYLKIFAPYLRICDLESEYVGSSKEPIIKYVLQIDGNEIKQEDNPIGPSFRYSLSEGDKSALAFSFFLAMLEVEGNIKDKIIVFDDPVSSFDLSRKTATINNLINLGQQAKQLFVFTHNIFFACEFWKNANQEACECQCNKIEYIKNSSCIVEYFIDTETLPGVLKDRKTIKNYLTNGCYSDQERRGVARCLRPVLESYFHLKFFDCVSQNDWLGGFISKVRNSTPEDPYFRLKDNLSEMTEINNYSKKYHHRFNTNSETEPIADAELRNYCERTLKLIQMI